VADLPSFEARGVDAASRPARNITPDGAASGDAAYRVDAASRPAGNITPDGAASGDAAYRVDAAARPVGNITRKRAQARAPITAHQRDRAGRVGIHAAPPLIVAVAGMDASRVAGLR